MTKNSTLRRLAICAALIIGSSLAIRAQLQDNSTGKLGVAQATRQQQHEGQKGEGQPAPEVMGYWQSLSARSLGPLAVTWGKRSGTPESIFGRIPGAFGEASEIAARRFLEENAPLFKMKGGLEDLALSRSYGSPLG